MSIILSEVYNCFFTTVKISVIALLNRLEFSSAPNLIQWKFAWTCVHVRALQHHKDNKIIRASIARCLFWKKDFPFLVFMKKITYCLQILVPRCNNLPIILVNLPPCFELHVVQNNLLERRPSYTIPFQCCVSQTEQNTVQQFVVKTPKLQVWDFPKQKLSGK